MGCTSTNTGRSPNARIMLGQRRKRWAGVKPALVQHLVCTDTEGHSPIGPWSSSFKTQNRSLIKKTHNKHCLWNLLKKQKFARAIVELFQTNNIYRLYISETINIEHLGLKIQSSHMKNHNKSTVFIKCITKRKIHRGYCGFIVFNKYYIYIQAVYIGNYKH